MMLAVGWVLAALLFVSPFAELGHDEHCVESGHQCEACHVLVVEPATTLDLRTPLDEVACLAWDAPSAAPRVSASTEPIRGPPPTDLILR